MRKVLRVIVGWICLGLALTGLPARAADALLWREKQNTVEADVHRWEVPKLLKKIQASTGWQVWVEPGLTNEISAKFKGVNQDEALRRLLGNLNYLRDTTNGVTRLRVFSTVSSAATEVVAATPKDYRIANELLVKLKPGATNAVDDLAKKLGAKIVSRDDKIGFYRLQFADGASAGTALQSLLSDPSVAAAESNYVVDPPSPIALAPSGGGAPNINLNPPDTKGLTVGLIDTAMYPPDQYSKYMLTPINVTGATDPPSDTPTHGTGMLETVVNAMAADPSMIQPVIIYGAQDSTTTYDMMEGIISAVNSGDKLISISSGGTGDSQMLGDVIQEATAKGIQFVAAAGNTPGTEDTYPGAYPGVLAVTASGANGQLAPYADDGTFVQAIEPGTAIIDYENKGWYIVGTSTSTATAAGSIADLANLDKISPQQAAAQLTKIYPAPH